MHARLLELRPIAFLASCLFSNGDVACNHHGDLVRRLSVGRTPAQQDLILRFRDVFESLQRDDLDPNSCTIPTSRLRVFASKVVHDPTVLEAKIQSLQRRAAGISLAEVFAACGFVIDELTSAPTIRNAIEKLRLRVEAAEVRRIIGVVRNMCLKVLRFPNNSDYWRFRADSPAFQQKLGRFEGATHLVEAVGFVEVNKTHFELRGARTTDGKRTSALSKAVLTTLREGCVELDAELSMLDGVESVCSILQRISTERERDSPLTLDECQDILMCLSVYIENVLKNPKDARCWRIREANKMFQKQIGYLPLAADLMDSIGYELVHTSQGNVFALRGTGTLFTVESTKHEPMKGSSKPDASLSNFSFSRVSQQMEWFLWRKKQEIDTLLQDEMQYLVDIVRTRTAASTVEAKLPYRPESEMADPSAAVTKMYPYGKSAVDTFNRTSVQRKQIEMMRMAFDAIDIDRREFVLESDFDRAGSSEDTPSWATFEAFDIDSDGRVDFADFVAALGPVIDHPFDTCSSQESPSSVLETLTLCEKAALAVGRLRVSCNRSEALNALKSFLLMAHKIIQEPSNRAHWHIRELSDVGMNLLRFQAGTELVGLAGFRDLRSVSISGKQGDGEPASGTVGFVLQPQKLRFKTTKSAMEPPQSLDSATMARLQTVTGVVAGHYRGFEHPEVSDVSAVSRAIGFMGDSAGWSQLVELALLCIGNVLKHPEDERYRHLKTSTQTYKKVVQSVRGGHQLVLSLGFQETDIGMLSLPIEVSADMLKARQLELELGLVLLKAKANPIHREPAVLSIELRGARAASRGATSGGSRSRTPAGRTPRPFAPRVASARAADPSRTPVPREPTASGTSSKTSRRLGHARVE